MKINKKILLLGGIGLTLTSCASKGKIITGLTQNDEITRKESKILDRYSVEELWNIYQKFETKVEASYIDGKYNKEYLPLLKEYELDDVHEKFVSARTENSPKSIDKFLLYHFCAAYCFLSLNVV